MVGGILEHAQVQGFLSNRDRVMTVAQRSSDEDTEFLTEWFRVRELAKSILVEPQKTAAIFAALVPFVPKPRNGRDATEVSLGVYLAKVVDKVRTLDDGTTVAIRRGAPDKHANAQRWVAAATASVRCARRALTLHPALIIAETDRRDTPAMAILLSPSDGMAVADFSTTYSSRIEIMDSKPAGRFAR